MRQENSTKSKEYSHLYWKDRIFKEEIQAYKYFFSKYFYRSIQKGLELGLVEKLPCLEYSSKIDNNKVLNQMSQAKNACYLTKDEERAKYNPLNTIIYKHVDIKNIPENSVCTNENNILKSYEIGPFGLSRKSVDISENPLPSVKMQNKIKRCYMLNKPVGIKTFKDNEKCGIFI